MWGPPRDIAERRRLERVATLTRADEARLRSAFAPPSPCFRSAFAPPHLAGRGGVSQDIIVLSMISQKKWDPCTSAI